MKTAKLTPLGTAFVVLSAAQRAYFAELGRKGGSVKSYAKAAAVRRNGKKGGRPRKAT